MHQIRIALLLSFPLFFCSQLSAQISSFPYLEQFDSVITPSLPPGWGTSSNRLDDGDFFSTTTSPRSSPQSLQSANSTIPQHLISPRIDFSGVIPDRLQFWTARSGSHTSPLLIEASIDGGSSFPILLGDTLTNPGTTQYVQVQARLPESLGGQNNVRLRWRLSGGMGGATGTFRIDDVEILTFISHDLGVVGGVVTPQHPSSEDSISITFIVHNGGIFPSNDARLRFFLDENDDRRADPSEKFFDVPVVPLPPMDSTTVSATHPPLPQGIHRFLAVLVFPGDENSVNDTSAAEVRIGVPAGSILINEIMYEPRSGESEWFELYNPGSTEINLQGWAFSDAPSASGSAPTSVITDARIGLSPDGFALVCSDSTILQFFIPPSVPVFILNTSSGLGLGNAGDDLVLKDEAGETIDSIRYSPSWHQPGISDSRGRSLERINPQFATNDPHNWSTSASATGGSPGARNTIYTSRTSADGSLSFSPNPFSPDGDGFEDFCLISYRLPRTTALIRVTVFDLRGRHIRTLANSNLSGDRGEILWDGMDDQRRRARIGPHIVLLEAVDGKGESVVTLKGIIVVAAKL